MNIIRHSNTLFVIIFASFCPTQATSAQDQPTVEARVERLEKRMEGFDDKLDTILKAVSAKEPATTVPSAVTEGPKTETTQPSSASTVKLEPGPLLDFWVLKNDAPLDLVPEEYSLGTVVDEKALFVGKRFRDFAEFTPYWNSPTGMLWSGILTIQEGGKYTLSADLTLNTTKKDLPNDGRPTYSVSSWVDFEGTKVVQLSEQGRAVDVLDQQSRVVSQSHPLELLPGQYKVRVWLASIGQGTDQQAGLVRLEDADLTVKLRGPSDQKPVVLTKELLRHRAQ